MQRTQWQLAPSQAGVVGVLGGVADKSAVRVRNASVNVASENNVNVKSANAVSVKSVSVERVLLLKPKPVQKLVPVPKPEPERGPKLVSTGHTHCAESMESPRQSAKDPPGRSSLSCAREAAAGHMLTAERPNL